MSAACRCFCGCEKVERQLNDETSSDLTCRLCLMDRHLARHPMAAERLEELEWHVRDIEQRLSVPVASRIHVAKPGMRESA